MKNESIISYGETFCYSIKFSQLALSFPSLKRDYRKQYILNIERKTHAHFIRKNSITSKWRKNWITTEKAKRSLENNSQTFIKIKNLFGVFQQFWVTFEFWFKTNFKPFVTNIWQSSMKRNEKSLINNFSRKNGKISK